MLGIPKTDNLADGRRRVYSIDTVTRDDFTRCVCRQKGRHKEVVMAADFYTEWLGVPPDPRPPDYYTLLGVDIFCRDQDIIELAARRQLMRLDEFALYPDRDTRDAVQDMMNEVARARVDLVNPNRRLAYDRQLAQRLGVAVPPEVPAAVEAEMQSAPLPIEPEPSLQATPVAVEEVVDVATQFETRVWAHLQKWKLNAQEQRLLLAEAAALGVTVVEAMDIIERIDSEHDALAEEKNKRQVRLVLGLSAAAVVAVIAGVILSVVISERSSRERDFLAAIEAARKCLDEGDLAQAASELSTAKAIFPDDPMLKEVAGEMARVFTSVLSRVRSLTDRGDLDQAASELAKAKKMFPGDPRVKEAANRVALKRRFTGTLSQARSLIERGYLDQAAGELARAKVIFPGDPRLEEVVNQLVFKRKAMEKAFTGMLSRARSLMDSGDLGRAASELAKAKAVFPGDPRLKETANQLVFKRKAMEKAFTGMLSRARSLMDSGDLGRAASELAKAKAVFPGDPRLAEVANKMAEAYYNMGNARDKLRQYAEAIDAYKKAIAIKPDYAEAYCWMGFAWHWLKQYADAIAAYKKAIAIKPDYATAYSNMGFAHFYLTQYTDAIAAYKKAVAIKPDAVTYYKMGNAYRYLKQYTDAITAYKKCVALKPDYPYTYDYMGLSYHYLKQYTEALTAYKKAVAIKPVAVTYYNLGRLYGDLKQYTDAITAYKKCVALKQDYADAHHYMGLSYHYLKRHTYALAAYKKSVAIKPDAVTYSNMGLTYVKLKKHGFAIAAYKKAIVIKPDYANAYCSMGFAYDDLKRYTDALAAYKKAIALEPIGKTADAAREAIRRIDKYYADLARKLYPKQ